MEQLPNLTSFTLLYPASLCIVRKAQKQSEPLFVVMLCYESRLLFYKSRKLLYNSASQFYLYPCPPNRFNPLQTALLRFLVHCLKGTEAKRTAFCGHVVLQIQAVTPQIQALSLQIQNRFDAVHVVFFASLSCVV